MENDTGSIGRRHVFFLNGKTCLLVEQDDMSSCSTRSHVFLFNRRRCPLVQKDTCLLVQRRGPERNPLGGVQGKMLWEACISSADLPMLPMAFVHAENLEMRR